MKDILKGLIINWLVYPLSNIPTGDWTMEKEGAKIVSIANVDFTRSS